ncbi:MAG: DNA mismatch endonuclease Vsr [Deltaproteobacteria bacterium]|nr:DNA mismatch endonuclease Vsr [Deltaproteobacteria bacterium]
MAMTRSDNMRRIRNKDTAPELTVRRLLRGLGFVGYRLHREDLPGKPDIAFIGRKKAVLIHGCFWHGHDCKEGLRRPKSNQTYWLPKIERNCKRDAEHLSDLARIGWSVLTVWECNLRNPDEIAGKLCAFMQNAYLADKPRVNACR